MSEFDNRSESSTSKLLTTWPTKLTVWQIGLDFHCLKHEFDLFRVFIKDLSEETILFSQYVFVVILLSIVQCVLQEILNFDILANPCIFQHLLEVRFFELAVEVGFDSTEQKITLLALLL